MQPSPSAAAAGLERELFAEFDNSFPEHAAPNGDVVEFGFSAGHSSVEILPGLTTEVWAYDAQIPGPTLRVKLGQTLRLDFHNNLPDKTTIHFHGVRVPNAMDGVPGVTQPPIEPGASFVYRFTPKDAGTFWFHPHVRGAEQVERGLYGVLIVEDPNEPPYHRDLVWILDDWKLHPDGKLDDRFVTRHDLAHDGRWGNVRTVNGRMKPVVKVKPGERFRLRMVVSANGRMFQPDFSQLIAKGIAFDGMTASEPFDPTGYTIAPGNRLDLDITIPPALRGKRVEIIDRFSSRRPATLAVLSVEDVEPVATPSFPPPTSAKLPRWKRALEAPIDMEMLLAARRGGKYGIEWVLNDTAWPERQNLALKHRRFQRIRFKNDSARLHPMHLHGQFFKLLAVDGRRVDERHWRDTVLVRGKQTVDIGLVPLDKGTWAQHCHILEHAESGMMTVFDVE
jgi:FtsP/CotA-like multicopper oxidase with cupredoxin domain